MKHLFLSLLPVGLLLTACHDKPKEAAVLPDPYRLDGTTVVVDPNQPLASRLHTAPVVAGSYVQRVTAPAKLEANATRSADITPPFAGRIVKVFVRLGDDVRAGQPLFSIEAPDFNSARKDYQSARQSLALARLNLSRQQDLLKNGVGIRKELEETRTDYAIKEDDLKTADERLAVYGVSGSNSGKGGALVVKSPLAGRVGNVKLAPGQLKNDANEVLLSVTDVRDLWIVADVKEKDLRFVRKGDSASAVVTAYPSRVFRGKITLVDNEIDPASRSLNVRVQTPNAERLLLPGMFATVSFASTALPALRIPAKAVLQKSDSSYVFVQVGPHRYKPRAVQLLETTANLSVVKSGLKAGELVVSDGAVYLLSAL